MKFKDIAIKNFKVNLKKYLSYFLCSGFSVTIFFMYSTILFNRSINDSGDKEIINMVFYISLVVIALFSIFFINYAHTAFIKSRYKEFGIYMTLGMTTKDIRKIILIENLLIIFSSLISGLVTGLLFSRLFQMIVASILDIENLSYAINSFSFVLTISLFAFIFLIVLIFSRAAASKFEIGELLKKSRENEREIKSRILPGILGITVLALSLISFVCISEYDELNSNMIVVVPHILVIFAGGYMTISFMGMAVMCMMKKNPKRYFKNLLVLTEITHKFNQNKKIIFVLSILSSMIVFFVASPFSLYSLSEKISGINQPHHLEFASVYNANKINEQTLEDIFKESPTKLKSETKVEFLSLKFKTDENATDILGAKPVISQSRYNQLTKSNLSLQKGEVFNAITAWQPGTFGISKGKTLSLTAGETSVNFHVVDSARAPWVSSGNSFPSNSGLVLNDGDYAALKEKIISTNIGTYYIFDFDNWKGTGKAIESLKAELNQPNKQNPLGLNESQKMLTVLSRLETYDTLKRAYSMFMFVTTVMGILFFIAAGSVLFFKQYTEIGSAKEKFYKLFKIGITKKEARKILSKELAVTFFAPLIFGSIMGYAFIYFMTHLVGGQDVMTEFMQNATKVVFGYFVFQAGFFLVTRKKYVGEVLEKF